MRWVAQTIFHRTPYFQRTVSQITEEKGRRVSPRQEQTKLRDSTTLGSCKKGKAVIAVSKFFNERHFISVRTQATQEAAAAVGIFCVLRPADVVLRSETSSSFQALFLSSYSKGSFKISMGSWDYFLVVFI
jgi:hypothetical protein